MRESAVEMSTSEWFHGEYCDTRRLSLRHTPYGHTQMKEEKPWDEQAWSLNHRRISVFFCDLSALGMRLYVLQVLQDCHASSLAVPHAPAKIGMSTIPNATPMGYQLWPEISTKQLMFLMVSFW
nr:hypothetical protein Iba_chr10eCG4460 [Ipomoea batatas]